jgi:hypothetical protein
MWDMKSGYGVVKSKNERLDTLLIGGVSVNQWQRPACKRAPLNPAERTPSPMATTALQRLVAS